MLDPCAFETGEIAALPITYIDESGLHKSTRLLIYCIEPKLHCLKALGGVSVG